MARRTKRFRWKKRLMLLALAAGGWYAYQAWWKQPGGSGLGPGSDIDRSYVVTRGDFEILVLTDGTVEPIRRHNLIMRARGHFPLVVTYLVDDNSYVDQGDLVMEFQTDRFIERIDDLVQAAEDLERNLDLELDKLAMVRARNIANLKSAADRLRNAEDALEKYENLEVPKARRDQQEAIEKAEAAIVSAEAALHAAEEARRAALGQDASVVQSAINTVATRTKALSDAQLALENVFSSQRSWRQYDYPQRTRTLAQAVEQARLDLEQRRMEANNNVFNSERTITRLRQQIRQNRDDQVSFRRDLGFLTLHAPIAGMVNLGNLDRPAWERTPKEWEVGTTAGTNEVVASIPDLSKFLIKCQVPEAHRSRIRIDQPARLISTAVPDLRMDGRLSMISPVAMHLNRRDQNSPKVYNLEISTDTSDARLMPGMSVKIEILVEWVENVIFVPVEAISVREDIKYVRVITDSGAIEEREVETNRSSISHIEITRGLYENERVILIATQFDGA